MVDTIYQFVKDMLEAKASGKIASISAQQIEATIAEVRRCAERDRLDRVHAMQREIGTAIVDAASRGVSGGSTQVVIENSIRARCKRDTDDIGARSTYAIRMLQLEIEKLNPPQRKSA